MNGGMTRATLRLGGVSSRWTAFMSRGERDPWAARLPRPTTTPRPSAQVDVIVVPARREPDAPTMVASRRASPTVGIAAVGAGAVIASAFIGSAIFYVPF